MSLTLSRSKPRRLRPAAPRALGGASSLLRLSHAASLPSGAALTGWAQRAGTLLETPVVFVPGAEPAFL